MKWTQKIEQLFRKRRSQREENTKVSIIDTSPAVDPIPINFSKKILVIADTHGCLNESEIPNEEYDLCLILGDVFVNDLEIVSKHVTVPIYGVLGNHDGFDLFDRFKIINLHNRCIDAGGISISGIQGSIKYKNSAMPLYTDDESIEIANSTGPADILISHDGPREIFNKYEFAHSGLLGIDVYLQTNKTPLHLHGHHHDPSRNVLSCGTTSICCYGVEVVNTKNI